MAICHFKNKTKWGGVISKKKPNDYSTGIPVFVVRSLAKSILSDIVSFYESKEGQEYFEKWKAAQEKKDKK